MSGNKKAFLFVNKDLKSPSLTKSSEEEQSFINSHVQRGRRHHRQPHPSSRRRELTKDIPPPSLPQRDESTGSGGSPSGSSTSSGSLPVRPSPPLASRLLSDNQTHDHGRRPSDESDTSSTLRIRTAQQTSDDLVNIASPLDDAEGRGHHTSGGLLTPNDSPTDITQFVNSIDPFQHASIPLDAKTHSLIQYYKNVYHPAVWHVESRASSKGDYAFQTTSADVIRSALQSDVDMFALLACMASRLQYVDMQPGYSTDEYVGKALSATRRFIARRASQGPKSHEEILMVIFHLYATEGYRNNIAAAKVHMKGAKTIVKAIGGLSKLRDPQMQELLIIGDGLLSAMTLQPCELPCEFDPGDYLEATPENLRLSMQYDLDNIAPALRHRPRSQIIPQAIQTLLDQIAELNWVLKHAKHGSPEASKHAMRWISMRSMAIRHRLLEFEATDPRLDVFRGTLVLWIVTTTTLLGLQKLALVIAPQIRAKLLGVVGQGLDFDHHDIKAWILSMGSMSAMPGSHDSAWFISSLAELLRSMTMTKRHSNFGNEGRVLEQLRRVQESFFYHEAVHEASLQNVAKRLVHEGAAGLSRDAKARSKT